MDLNQYLLDEISGYFMCNSETISIAESVTGGWLQLAFSEMPNSNYFIRVVSQCKSQKK